MFCRSEDSVPGDFIFPEDLNGLGYYLNDKDQLRQIKAPDRKFHYFCSKNDRFVEMHKEAFSTCVRGEVLSRLELLGLKHVRLPLGATHLAPHVPVLVSSNLDVCSKVIVFIGESCQDLGILSGRIVGQETVNGGSAVNWVEYALRDNCKHDDLAEEVGIVIGNPGQLVWWRRNHKAISLQTFRAIPRKSAVAPGLIYGEKNLIPENRNPAEHVECLFGDIVSPLIDRGCKINIVGIEDGATEVVQHLERNWSRYGGKIDAMVLLTACVWTRDFANNDFEDWFGKRARAYIISHEPFGTPLRGRESSGCNIYSGDENYHVESIFPNTYFALLDYFKLVNRTPDYENLPLEIPEPDPIAGIWGEDSGWAEDFSCGEDPNWAQESIERIEDVTDNE